MLKSPGQIYNYIETFFFFQKQYKNEKKGASVQIIELWVSTVWVKMNMRHFRNNDNLHSSRQIKHTAKGLRTSILSHSTAIDFFYENSMFPWKFAFSIKIRLFLRHSTCVLELKVFLSKLAFSTKIRCFYRIPTVSRILKFFLFFFFFYDFMGFSTIFHFFYVDSVFLSKVRFF